MKNVLSKKYILDKDFFAIDKCSSEVDICFCSFDSICIFFSLVGFGGFFFFKYSSLRVRFN